MNRIVTTTIALSLIAILGTAAEGKPNIVIILADDLGSADLSCLGSDIRTPNIDSLVTNGVSCAQAYATAPVCAPSRAGLLTGRYQHRFGFEDNPGPFLRSPDIEAGMDLNERTIADRLRKLGYVTGMVGKWHDGKEKKFQPPARGFDEFYGFNNGAQRYLNVDSSKTPMMRGTKPEKHGQGYLTDTFGKEAVAFVERHHAKPFFLYLSFNAPHGPLTANEKYLNKYAAIKDPKRRAYAAMIDAIDVNVGALLNKLRGHKIEKNTLVIFLSDHGGVRGKKGTWASNGLLRAGKGTLYEGGLRTPMIFQWKGKLPAGGTVKHPVTTLDLLPTAISAAGGQIENRWELDGVNLMPFLSGEKTGRPNLTIYWRLNEMWAVRDGDWKVVKDRGIAGPKLFDLAKDPNEKKDLAGTDAVKVKELTEKFEAWASTVERPRFGWWQGVGKRIEEWNKVDAEKHKQLPADGLAQEQTDLNAEDITYQGEKKRPNLTKPIIDTKPKDLGDGIPVGSLAESDGDEQAILKLSEQIAAGKFNNVDSLLIAHKGKLLLESYYRKGRPNLPHYQMSITKSMVALALGRAMQLGHIKDLNTPVVNYLKKVDQTKLVPGATLVTISECLNMHSGIRIPIEKAKAAMRERDKLKGQGQAQAFLSLSDPITAESKQHKYQGADPSLVIQVLDAVVPGSAKDFIRKEFYDKLGFKNYLWQDDVSGLPKAAAGMSLRSRDMLKVGLMIAQNGKWNGEQLWSEEYIRKAVSPLHTNPVGHTYGYLWWGHDMESNGKKHRCISARGAGGQFIFILPSVELIVVVTSHNNKDMRSPMQFTSEQIVPAFLN
jgi:arylsulfatase A-like enzyme/CubicO group peptidase (beta-lactamase class C family)